MQDSCTTYPIKLLYFIQKQKKQNVGCLSTKKLIFAKSKKIASKSLNLLLIKTIVLKFSEKIAIQIKIKIELE